jgi:non-ribosomal peptide synthetase component E (peptide arylation enzyme)
MSKGPQSGLEPCRSALRNISMTASCAALQHDRKAHLLFVADAVASNPDSEAIVAVRALTYRISSRSSRMGQDLARVGCWRGDRVAMLLGNDCISCCLFAALRLGPSPCRSTSANKYLIDHMLAHCGARFWCTRRISRAAPRRLGDATTAPHSTRRQRYCAAVSIIWRETPTGGACSRRR